MWYIFTLARLQWILQKVLRKMEKELGTNKSRLLRIYAFKNLKIISYLLPINSQSNFRRGIFLRKTCWNYSKWAVSIQDQIFFCRCKYFPRLVQFCSPLPMEFQWNWFLKKNIYFQSRLENKILLKIGKSNC